MGYKIHLIFFTTLALLVQNSHGECTIYRNESPIDTRVPISLSIYDITRGEIFNGTTDEVTGISNITYTSALNGGPYLYASFIDSQFAITTTDEFENYEEYETLLVIYFSVNLFCTGTTDILTLLFGMNIIDTNNHYPELNEVYEYQVVPPMPQGFQITGCWNNMKFRDIDLTTQKLDFEVHNNTFFELEYDPISSSEPKEFQAILKTTTLIRSIPEPIEFRISATDVDLTTDPRLTSYATIRITSDNEYAQPEELVFSQTFYSATFTNAQVVLQDPISLRQGFDGDVHFTLKEFTDIFSVTWDDNNITISVISELTADMLRQQQILLVLQAEREHTSGASATIIIQMPEDVILNFQQNVYVGQIVEGSLELLPLTLTSGYDFALQLNTTGEHASYFSLTQASNNVIVSMDPEIPSYIIENNAFILLDIEASYPDAVSAFTSVILETIKEPIVTVSSPVFEEAYYIGHYSNENGLVFEQRIQLIENYESASFNLSGDQSQWFNFIPSENSVEVVLADSNPIPVDVITNNNQLIFLVTAQRPGSAVVWATIIIELNREVSTDRILEFDNVSYIGSIVENVVKLDPIVLSKGYENGVLFTLHGDLQLHFRPSAEDNTVTLELIDLIAPEDIPSNRIIVLNIEASYLETSSAFATIVLEIKTNETAQVLPAPIFTETFYVGALSTDKNLTFETTISLEEESDEYIFNLESDQSQWFDFVPLGNFVQIILREDNPIPPAVIDSNQQLLFFISAHRPGSATARATVVILLRDDLSSERILAFDRLSYIGSIDDSTINLAHIVLIDGYVSGVVFTLHGDLRRYFRPNAEDETVTIELLEPIAHEDIPSNGIIVLNIEASYPETSSSFATIVLEIKANETAQELPAPIFTDAFYVGTLSTTNNLTFDTDISLEEESDEYIFNLESEQSQWFDFVPSGNSVQIILREDNPIPPAVIDSNQQLLFVITAHRPGSATARATVVILLRDDVSSEHILAFDRLSYIGSIDDSTINLDQIVLIEGYISGVLFTLHGDLRRYFRPNAENGIVTVELLEPIAQEDVPSNGIIVLNIEASYPETASTFATIVLEIEGNSTTPNLFDPVFAEPFYVGTFSPSIGLTFAMEISLVDGIQGSITFDLESENSQWFRLVPTENSVQLILREENPIPPAIVADNQQLIFVITAGRSGSVIDRATIVIQLINDGVTLPTVSFDSTSYVIQAAIGQTGLIGSVKATADNGESITYSLFVENEHLNGRITINGEGDIHLTYPVYSGVYIFQVVATAVTSQVTGSAMIHLSVNAHSTCENTTVIAPLIVLDRYEEQPLQDLVLLDPTEHAGCHFSLTSRWPADQPWLYVDETGLHATTIDREDPSIAFMALSQIQVELSLVCDSDVTRIKRSVGERLDWLGSYDYGTNTWLLGETIQFNPKRSIVNLIVNDINDNAPIFVGKGREPIIVGYPAPELQQTISPRSLVELQATDADVGLNAALVYWSAESALAVSSTTGFVHVRDEQGLEQDQILIVNATDQNGQGHTGSITLMVKLLQSNNIVVITVRNAFLEDEHYILSNISNAIGYEVKSLRSSVMSNAEVEYKSRMKREVTTTGASLELYVYGLDENEPVEASTLKTDIGNAAVITDNIASILSLEDHLEGLVICNNLERDAGLFAATIVLSVLLFTLIVAIIVWFLLTRKRNKNYENFSDANSLASRNESLEQAPKPLEALAVAKPRLNIEELKKSEKRLQDMLNAPIDEISIEPDYPAPSNTVTKMPEPLAPIVIIQDKLKNADDESDDDEFGEIRSRRKSVTFNENVEKIIHVSDTPDNSETTEVFKL